jgi:hypothetical protein
MTTDPHNRWTKNRGQITHAVPAAKRFALRQVISLDEMKRD